MTLKEYKKYCLKQLGYRYGNDKIQINKDIFRKLTENTNLFTNEVAEMILLHANYYGTTSEFQQWYYTCTEEEMWHKMSKITSKKLTREVTNREKILRMKKKVEKLEKCLDSYGFKDHSASVASPLDPSLSNLALIMLYLSYYSK